MHQAVKFFSLMAALFFVYLKNEVFHGYVSNHLLRFCQNFCLINFFTIFGTTVVQKKRKELGFRRKKIKRKFSLQTLEIWKKLLQIYCYQSFLQ